MIGKTLGHYQVLEKIGQGGMGVVYKARDTHLDRFVAIKVLPPERISDAARKARFVQEAKAASALNHPNIITIYDISSDGGHDFIAMEYVAGKTLDQIIPRKGMRLGEALKIAVQIADALARAHEAGIVHRDLKPANIMVDEHGLVKVLDFGLAKLSEPADREDATTVTMGAETEEGAIVGTAAYMSPEQAQGKKVDARSDVFSFGAVLYEMVTGRRAFQADSRISTLSAVLHQEPKPLEDVPHDLEKVIVRCLRKDPDRRWQYIKDLKVELEELREESDSGKLAPAFAAPVKPHGWLWAAVVAVLAVVALAGWLILKHSGRRSPQPALVQLTSYPGSELYPCFSPDGRQVAFAWDGEKSDNYDIYVKLVGETDALRLTTDPAPEQFPAWSPDGKRIAFRRNRPRAPGIWLVSPLGGAEQKLADLQTMGQISWSPDGRWLAVARGISAQNVGDARGIFLVPADGGEPRRITNPKAPAFDWQPSFSPDGRSLAYAACMSRWSCDLFIQPLDSGYVPREDPRRITQQGIDIAGLAWSHDGGTLVYGGSLSWGMTRRLLRAGSSGRQKPERLDLAGFSASDPCIAPAGDRLAFARDTVNFDIWRFQLGGAPEAFLRSSLHDGNAQFSPDGSRIAFSSCRSGDVFEIWVADAGGSHPVQLTTGSGHGQGTPRWSPDGRLIAYDSLEQDGLSHVYVIDANGGRPRRISSGTSSDFAPSWSRDGKWIYFYSDRTGLHEVWRVPLAEGAVQQITENGGEAAFESTDGKTLFYVKSPPSSLFARSLDGGPERKILDYVTLRAFAVFDDGIYYIGRLGVNRQYPIQFYEFSTGTSRLLTEVEGPLQNDLSVSPDRKTILFSKSATSGSDLMLIENFR